MIFLQVLFANSMVGDDLNHKSQLILFCSTQSLKRKKNVTDLLFCLQYVVVRLQTVLFWVGRTFQKVTGHGRLLYRGLVNTVAIFVEDHSSTKSGF